MHTGKTGTVLFWQADDVVQNRLALSELDLICFPDKQTSNFAHPPYDSSSSASSSTAVASHNGPEHICAVWEIDKKPCGFALASHIYEQAELLSIGVAPTHRRHGGAARLLEALHSKLRSCGVEALHLEVADSNKAALRLYESFGYKPIRRRPDYYRTRSGSSEAALCMFLNLKTL